MNVKNIFYYCLILPIKIIFFMFQIFFTTLIFFGMVIPSLIIEYIINYKKEYVCKTCKVKLIEQGYPDEIGFQSMRCPKCGQ